MVRVPSNAGGLGGVTLHRVQTCGENDLHISEAVEGQFDPDRGDKGSLVAVEGEFDGVFHDATAVAGWERRGGVRELHAGKSL